MSRWDLSGIFWQDRDHTKGDTSRPLVLPAIPESDWRPVRDFPNLSSAKIIGLDTETYDPNLVTHGPGWARDDGHIVGVSLSVKGGAWYFPIRHELQPELNMPLENVISYLKDVLQTNIPKVGANLQYDVGWLRTENIYVKGMLYDIQYAEALLDDVARSYSLETIANKYLGKGKVSAVLYRWLARAYGGSENARNQGKNIHRAPITLVAPYAEADAAEPLEILDMQFTRLKDLGLWELFELECRLTPLLIDMRYRGIPVNLDQSENVKISLTKQELLAQEELDKLAGFTVSVHSGSDLKLLFDKQKVKYPYTEKGNPSFTQTWLDLCKNKCAQMVNNIRKLQKCRVTFIENGIEAKHVNGVIHPSFHPLRGESGGAVSGRLSSSNPNAQQIPSRNKVLAPLIRGLYVPEQGYTDWLKLDLSQIEYRFFAHYSQDEKLIAEYQYEGTDYHNVVGKMLGGTMPRGMVKNFNFMSIYGGGRQHTIDMITENISEKELTVICEKQGIKANYKTLGNHFVDLYAERFPAAKETMTRVSNEAQEHGEIRTILNRRNTFDLWEPKNRGNKAYKAYTAYKAFEIYGETTALQRSATYKALNRKLQGSAADLLKKGMVDCYEAGLFRNIGAPHITVHDELDFSYHKDLKQDALLIKKCIENTIKLKVPVIMDAEIGPDWGHVKEMKL